MASRLNLQDELETILGSENVYFQPPESVRMSYPAIRYKLDRMAEKRADNLLYNYDRCYQLTLIARDPDTDLVDKILKLPKCSFDRFYTADNLNHYTFTIYY